MKSFKLFFALFILLLFSCSDFEQKTIDLVLEDAVASDLPVLSQDESIALSVLKNGSYSFSESDALTELCRFSDRDYKYNVEIISYVKYQ